MMKNILQLIKNFNVYSLTKYLKIYKKYMIKEWNLNKVNQNLHKF